MTMIDNITNKNMKTNSQTQKLTWNVFLEDINAQQIVTRNVFDHGGFYNDLVKIKKTYDDKKRDFIKNSCDPLSDERGIELAAWDESYKNTVFTDEVQRALSYYFWARAEYEVIITSWPPFVEKDEVIKLQQELDKTQYRHVVNLSFEKKIDIYDQVRLNFDRFIDYLWENRALIKKAK